MLCFTHGEASTLGLGAGDLCRVRAGDLAAAAAVLGVAGAGLLDYPDGRLAGIPLSQLAGDVRQGAELTGPEALLVFDEGGITGRPGHCQAATSAAPRTWQTAGAPALMP